MRLVPVIFAALLLASCAGQQTPQLQSGTPGTQDIMVQTLGGSGANCFVQGEGGSYPVISPGIVTVRVGEKPLEITCFKGEHMIGRTTLQPRCKKVCGYPASASIPMGLDPTSMQREIIRINQQYR
jgi:hypothetical protein